MFSRLTFGTESTADFGTIMTSWSRSAGQCLKEIFPPASLPLSALLPFFPSTFLGLPSFHLRFLPSQFPIPSFFPSSLLFLLFLISLLSRSLFLFIHLPRPSFLPSLFLSSSLLIPPAYLPLSLSSLAHFLIILLSRPSFLPSPCLSFTLPLPFPFLLLSFFCFPSRLSLSHSPFSSSFLPSSFLFPPPSSFPSLSLFSHFLFLLALFHALPAHRPSRIFFLLPFHLSSYCLLHFISFSYSFVSLPSFLHNNLPDISSISFIPAFPLPPFYPSSFPFSIFAPLLSSSPSFSLCLFLFSPVLLHLSSSPSPSFSLPLSLSTSLPLLPLPRLHFLPHLPFPSFFTLPLSSFFLPSSLPLPSSFFLLLFLFLSPPFAHFLPSFPLPLPSPFSLSLLLPLLPPSPRPSSILPLPPLSPLSPSPPSSPLPTPPLRPPPLDCLGGGGCVQV
ncbi:hypothetical protein C7M84_003891 [Penaeus vannamei]|uniref:Uncharacterized protein n=1 Tax=Penaeus vannamei TaxID=6689 RepID=A0A423TM10_PENVA|nr:hypothetical protein C7M84_003891 [Penaeus vannamei]